VNLVDVNGKFRFLHLRFSSLVRILDLRAVVWLLSFGFWLHHLQPGRPSVRFPIFTLEHVLRYPDSVSRGQSPQ
jgi:hypothetical protein